MTPRSVGRIELKELTEFFDSNAAIFRYVGSLTTPPCSERVMWTIGQRVHHLSLAQMTAFKRAMGGRQNFRPTQPTNGRRVLSNI
jgi:carbonic anhydrase